MASNKKLVEKGKIIYQRFIDNVGRKNYEKKLKENPEEYGIGYNSPKKIKQLIKEAKTKKANIYKGYYIPIQYKNKTLNEYLKNNIRDKVNDNMNKNINGLSAPFFKRIKLSNYKKKADKLRNKYFKLKNNYNKIDEKGRHYKEELADNNVPKFLKQTGIPKKDRQAHYYTHKNVYPYQDGRYQSRFGNLKYLKDYIFGFSELYKPLIRRINYDA